MKMNERTYEMNSINEFFRLLHITMLVTETPKNSFTDLQFRTQHLYNKKLVPTSIFVDADFFVTKRLHTFSTKYVFQRLRLPTYPSRIITTRSTLQTANLLFYSDITKKNHYRSRLLLLGLRLRRLRLLLLLLRLLRLLGLGLRLLL